MSALPYRHLPHNKNVKCSIATSVSSDCDTERISSEHRTIKKPQELLPDYSLQCWLNQCPAEDPWSGLIISHPRSTRLGYEIGRGQRPVAPEYVTAMYGSNTAPEESVSERTCMLAKSTDPRAEETSGKSDSRSLEANVGTILFRHILQDVGRNIGIDGPAESVSEISCPCLLCPE